MSEQEYARSFCIDKHRIPTNSNIELMLGNPIPSTRTTLRLFGRNRQTLEPPNESAAKKLWPGSIEFIFKLWKNAKDMRSLADFLFLSEFASKEWKILPKATLDPYFSYWSKHSMRQIFIIRPSKKRLAFSKGYERGSISYRWLTLGTCAC